MKQNIFSLLDGFLLQFIQLLMHYFQLSLLSLDNLSKHRAWPVKCDFWKQPTRSLVRGREHQDRNKVNIKTIQHLVISPKMGLTGVPTG